MYAPTGYRRTLMGMVAALCIFGAACAGGDNGQETPTSTTTVPSADTSATQYRLGMAVHVDEPTEPGFWTAVALGAFEAAESFNVDLEVRGDFDPGVQARIVETMIAEGIDGLIVTLADPEAMKPALDQAAAAGVPCRGRPLRLPLNCSHPSPSGRGAGVRVFRNTNKFPMAKTFQHKTKIPPALTSTI